MASATGWTVEYIMEGVAWRTLILMTADAPRYRRKTDGGKGKLSAEEEAEGILGMWQSRMK